MGTHVLSLRIDGELLERLRGHAAKRGMSVQGYVLMTLARDDFDERFRTAVEETERLGSWGGEPGGYPALVLDEGRVRLRHGEAEVRPRGA